MENTDLKQTTGQFMRLMLEFYYRFQEYPMEKGKFRPGSLSFHILFRLYVQKDRTLTIRELTEKLRISKPQLIKLVNHLEEDNLVVRERFRENRRIVYLSLSEEGADYLTRILGAMEKNLTNSLAAKDPARVSAFAEGVRKIAEAIET